MATRPCLPFPEGVPDLQPPSPTGPHKNRQDSAVRTPIPPFPWANRCDSGRNVQIY